MSELLERVLGTPAPWIVGVVNVTPDSFSDSGAFYKNVDVAVEHALALVADGAHILEIGGEATGPGSTPVSPTEELRRIEPVVRELAARAPVSIDTFHASTAQRCLDLGAMMINDVSGLRADEEMARVVAEHSAFLVIMHSKDGPLPHVSSSEREYGDIVHDVAQFLRTRTRFAESAGIRPERIICDPGMGRFLGSNPELSWELLRRYGELCMELCDYDVMVAVSRKGFLGGKLEERDAISQLVSLEALRAGATLVRTHNVRLCKQFIDCDAKLRL